MEVRPRTPDTGREQAIPSVIWLLLIGSLVVRSAGFAYPFLAYHVAGRGYAAGAIGAVLASYGVGWAVGQLATGSLVDRIGTRTTLVATMSLAAAVLLLMAEARSLPMLLTGALVAGLVCDAPRTVLGAAITELVADPRQRARLDGWRFGWALNVGAALTGGLGGLLAGWAGTPLLYWVNGIACAAFAVLAMRCIPVGSSHPVTARQANGGYRQALSDSRLMLMVGSSLATLTALMTIFVAMPILMSASGLSAGAYGLVQLTNSLAVVVLTPAITPWLSARLAIAPRLDILAVAGVWLALCMGAVALAHTTVAFTLAAAACSPAEIAWFVVAAGVVHRIAPAGNRGLYQGIWSMTTAAAAVVAPILVTCVLPHGGRPVLAVALVAVGLLGAASCSPMARSLSRVN
ncbi:MFS transporter [Mycobacterium sp. ML4]